MYQEIQNFHKSQLKKKLPQVKTGDTVKVHQKIKEGDKERIQIFEGLVIAIKGNSPLVKRITVRRIASGVGVERIFPLNSPMIQKIEVVKRHQVHQAKLYYLRQLKGKMKKLKEYEGEMVVPRVEPEPILKAKATSAQKSQGAKPEKKKEVKSELKSKKSSAQTQVKADQVKKVKSSKK